MKLEELVNKHKASLNQTDMLIWKYIFNHKVLCRHMSIHDLAHECNVSSTTIVRFAKKLSLEGFSDLKAVLKLTDEKRVLGKEPDVLASVATFYQHTCREIVKRNFDDASQLMYKARRVFAYASGYVQSNVVQELKRMFFYDDVMIYEVKGQEEFHSLVRLMNKDDLVIMVSLSGETPLAVEFAQKLQLKEVPLISITQLRDNTLASLSTENLYVMPAFFQLYEEEDRPQYQSMMPYFLLIEIWYVKYKMFRREKSQ
jgi:RpiR family transcriptional regulator, glv operon transcriptional regulator